jgi:uncharacterized protein (DUF2344 family)
MNRNINNIAKSSPDNKAESQFYSDVCSLIDNARYRVAATANAEVRLMNWQIGKRIKEDVLYNLAIAREYYASLNTDHKMKSKKITINLTKTCENFVYKN